MKIYVASSWRNEYQPALIRWLTKIFGAESVYDFRNPGPGKRGFQWGEIDPNWREWSAEDYIAALQHAIANDGYKQDFDAMKAADVCVLLLPCGRSAHLEAGWMKGAGKKLVICTRDGEEPELMAKMADAIVTWWDLPHTLNALAQKIDAPKPFCGGGGSGHTDWVR